MPGAGERVVITGVGAFTACGDGWNALREALLADRRALAPAGDALPEARDRTVGLARDLSMFRSRFPQIRPPLPIALTRMAMLAADEALKDARLDRDALSGAGAVLNRNRGPASVLVEMMQPVLLGGPRKSSPLLFSQGVANAQLGAVATLFGINGPQLVTMGGGGVLLASEIVRRGEAAAVLLGGLEEIEVNCLLGAEANGFIQPRAAPDRYRPFDAGSAGTTLGEGAVFCLLERESSARRRGATIRAELSSVATSLGACARPITGASFRGWGDPDGAALEETARDALSEAGASAGDIELCVSGANGLAAVDEAESDALRMLGLQDRPICTLKAHLGEGFGLSVVASLAYAADAIHRGELHRAASGEGPGSRALAADWALITQIDYQAQYTAAVVRRYAA
jgi:3-oxoacyl-[acyl-carrier-protein] synthase II